MKKVLALFAAMTLIFTLVACGGSKPKTETEKVPTVKVLDSMGPMPEWIETGDEIGKFNGEQVIFFVGTGESKDKSTAQEAAQLNAAGAAATAIKALATKQVARAWEAIGAGENEQKEQVMKGLEAISAKNVDVSGLRKAGVYWRFVSKSLIQNGKVIGWGTPQYEYYVKYAMAYDTYVARRDGVINQQKKEIKLNDRQKKLYADMENKLSELDEAAE
ncbi:MAG: hypothetical protein CVV50_00725 [Spirochaetae bacterium HGW-Spirochaetae-6]|nr:MAG: hypothetical protein CVV50_00725 [Spirochaetae bacterium HGW-Spirochaetae-6]